MVDPVVESTMIKCTMIYLTMTVSILPAYSVCVSLCMFLTIILDLYMDRYYSGQMPAWPYFMWFVVAVAIHHREDFSGPVEQVLKAFFQF